MTPISSGSAFQFKPSPVAMLVESLRQSWTALLPDVDYRQCWWRWGWAQDIEEDPSRLLATGLFRSCRPVVTPPRRRGEFYPSFLQQAAPPPALEQADDDAPAAAGVRQPPVESGHAAPTEVAQGCRGACSGGGACFVCCAAWRSGVLLRPHSLDGGAEISSGSSRGAQPDTAA